MTVAKKLLNLERLAPGVCQAENRTRSVRVTALPSWRFEMKLSPFYDNTRIIMHELWLHYVKVLSWPAHNIHNLIDAYSPHSGARLKSDINPRRASGDQAKIQLHAVAQAPPLNIHKIKSTNAIFQNGEVCFIPAAR